MRLTEPSATAQCEGTTWRAAARLIRTMSYTSKERGWGALAWLCVGHAARPPRLTISSGTRASKRERTGVQGEVSHTEAE